MPPGVLWTFRFRVNDHRMRYLTRKHQGVTAALFIIMANWKPMKREELSKFRDISVVDIINALKQHQRSTFFWGDVYAV